MLGYQPPPKAFRISHFEIVGAVAEKAAGEIMFGPLVALSRVDNALRMLDIQTSSMDKQKIKFYRRAVQGDVKASVEGADVFEYLKNAVLTQPPQESLKSS